jgi:hypothetical protein
MTWLFLIPAFAVGSLFTYNKALRESPYYFPAFFACGMVVSGVWVLASRRFQSDEKIMFFSLVWDVLMLLCYYVAPLLFKGESLSWQAYAASALALSGIFWFKLATG